ncbi:flagellar biosynthesis protein FlhB [Jeotgalibaca caeni]|uniref:flagellar biosynthesis protein FlhB n=1 Tax=Jeotgalibaca caeni TaxID=3028623 RepID=UPI00237D5333|nr:flagellar biosynthesis protein FlhB [Jeotgalibaca caeni]MDE1548268.1 flagellar biosynthesis protein FlhB [Jeotgalibaca caeni]
MSEKDGKTEKPTPKKLRDAKKKGEVAKSQELTSSLTFAVFALVGVSMVTRTLEQSFPILKRQLSTNLMIENIGENLGSIGMQAILYFFVLTGPFLAIAFLAAIIANVAQVGLFFSKESLKFKFNRLNPISGLKNMFSKKALFNLLKNLAKLALLFWVAVSSAQEASYYALNSGSVGMEKLFFVVLEIVKEVSTKLAIILFILGAADFAFQKYDYQKNLRMSKQEIKDEYKEMEGDPHIKSQRKQKHRQLTRRMLQDVETASIIITNPTHLAIAVRYDREKDPVPIVVAKGADHMAAKIRERATEHGVPIMENKPVARSLYKSVEVGQSIPADLYQALAEMLALVYQMELLKKKKI